MTQANQPYAPPAPVAVQRPLGVTILAVLTALGALSLIFLGLAVMGVGALTGIFAAFGAILGGIILLIGILELVVAYGLWTGKKWAWMLGLIFGILNIILGLVTITNGGILTLVINLIIVFYLFQPKVKAFFGR